MERGLIDDRPAGSDDDREWHLSHRPHRCTSSSLARRSRGIVPRLPLELGHGGRDVDGSRVPEQLRLDAVIRVYEHVAHPDQASPKTGSERHRLSQDMGVTVQKAALGHDIDPCAEQLLEVGDQVNLIQQRPLGSELDQEVDIARCSGNAACDGTEHPNATSTSTRGGSKDRGPGTPQLIKGHRHHSIMPHPPSRCQLPKAPSTALVRSVSRNAGIGEAPDDEAGRNYR